MRSKLQAALCAAVSLIAGCSWGDQRRAEKGLVHMPSSEPVAWLAPDRLISAAVDRWVAAGTAELECGGTGLFETKGGAFKAVTFKKSQALCEILARGVWFDLSPGGRQLAFSDAGKLNLLDLRTDAQTSFASSVTEPVLFAAWSRSGNHLVVVTSRDSVGASTISVVNSTTRHSRVIHPLSAKVISTPSWSPSDDRLALSLENPRSTSVIAVGEIVTTDTAGREWHVISSGVHPSWSPRGDWIAYISIATQPAHTESHGTVRVFAPSIRLIKSDGSEDQEFVAPGDTATYGTVDRMIEGSPWGRLVWSPDGSRIAFVERFHDHTRLVVRSLPSP